MYAILWLYCHAHVANVHPKKSIYPMANKMFTLALFVSVGETHWHVQTHTHTDKHLLGEYWFGRCDYYRSRCGKKREGKSFIHGLGHRKGLCGNLWNLFGFSSNEKWKLDFDFLGSFVNVMRRLGFWYAYTYIQFSDESINLFGQLICSLTQIQRLKRVKNRKKRKRFHAPWLLLPYKVLVLFQLRCCSLEKVFSSMVNVLQIK